MSLSKKEQQQLSLIAQFDDLVRMLEALLCEDNVDSQVKMLLQNCEKQRLFWLLQYNELTEMKGSFNQLMKKNRSLETTLKNVREAFKKELALRERIQGERDLLYAKLNQVQNYLQEDDDTSSKHDRVSLKETILSSLNLHKLTTLIENSNEDESSHSLSGVEFDKTDEDVLDDNYGLVETPMQTDQQVMKVDDIDLVTNTPIQNAVFANEDHFDDFSMLNDTVIIAEKDAITPLHKQRNTPFTRSQTSVNSKRSALSEILIKQRQSNLPNELKVDNRPHQFVTKKVFKPEKCCVCTGAIGFCSSCFHCRDCRAICHANCEEKVPLPCIPYVSRANIGKQGRLILISDYVPSVHCTSEIERRGLKQVGLYRVPGAEREVRELKEKILKSKHGIPQLNKVDVHVLCNVVKKFLLQLDEALIIRIAWRDFVEAANVENEEERSSRFREAILNLPNANRDTLAFLIMHLRRVSEHPENKMTIANLSKMFGPAVLGYSMRDPPSMQIFEENKKQATVVNCLLNLDDEFWQFILDLDTNQLTFSIVSPGDISMNIMHLSPDQHQLKAGRPSIGSRLCGGTVNSGSITPLKNKKKSFRNFKLNPLF